MEKITSYKETSTFEKSSVDVALVSRVIQGYLTHFDQPHKLLIQTPGRVNLIGEHTDYNEGFVLPTAINYHTVIASSPREDKTVRIVSLDYNNTTDEFTLDNPITFNKAPQMMWSNYIRGVIVEVLKKSPSLKGMDLVVAGNVPQGAGLSSSASLEVAVADTLNRLNNLNLTPADLAKIGQAAENNFVGCNCGIMDQMVVAAGHKDHAMLLDCRSLEIKPVQIPKSLSILIINSNKQRGLVGSEYNLRRASCEYAAKQLDISSLRDINEKQLFSEKNKLDELSFKRAKHVVTENQRTLDAAKALELNDLQKLSELMQASHTSMQYDFEITVPEIDLIVSLAHEVIKNRGGVRMTGGGFGGCVVALLPHDLIDEVIARIESEYFNKMGLNASFYICKSAEGSGEI